MVYPVILHNPMLFYLNLRNLHKSCHVENKLYLIRFDECILNLPFLWFFFIRSLFFLNGPQALYANLGCLKCISGINLSPTNKKLQTISFILYLLLTCWIPLNRRRPNKGILFNNVFIPKLLNNPLASYSLTNFDFLLSHTLHF